MENGPAKEKVFVPDSIEGLARIQQDNGRKRFRVGGVRRNNEDQLKGGRVLSTERELFAADEIIQQRRKCSMPVALVSDGNMATAGRH